MTTPTLQSIGRDLIGALNSVFTGSEGKVSGDKDFRIVWCQPGIPFSAADFAFAEANPNQILTAEQVRAFAKQQFNFAMAVDFIPDVTGVFDHDSQQALYRPTGIRLSTVFEQIMKASRVLNGELSDLEKAKLEKFRKFLYTTEKNIVTDAEVPKDGPVLQAYKDRYGKYLAAVREYRTKQALANSATGPAGVAAVNEFIYLGPILESQVNAAFDDWVASGYYNEVRDIFAYIEQTTARSPRLIKDAILDRIRMATLKDVGTNSDYMAATVIPGNFASSNSWTTFQYNSSAWNSTTEWASSSWSGGGGINLGFWSAGGSAGGSNFRNNEDLEIRDFRLSFSATQALITRPWFDPEFLATNRGWTLRQGAEWPYDDLVSDGGDPPNGRLPAYATVALFIKDLVIESEDFARHFSEHRESISVGASGGWGPFSFSGSYNRTSGGTSISYQRDGARITVEGMQLVGFLCRLLPLTPNPMSAADPDDFS